MPLFVNRCHILSRRFLVEKHPSSNTNIYSCHCRTCYIKCFDEFKLTISDKWSSTGSCRSVYSSKSYLNSLYNINGYAPVKVNIKSGDYSNAIYTCSSIGPTFGGRYDLYIHKNAASNSMSQTYCGYRCSSPLGTLHMVFPVDFMQVDPVSTSLPLTSRCFTRQQLKPCKGRSCLPIQAV